MDIRSFFGGKKSAPPEAKAEPATPPPQESERLATAFPSILPGMNAPTTEAEIIAGPSESLVVSSEALPKDVADLVDWAPNQNVPYKAVADAFERIGATSGRLEKESILCK